MGGRRVLLAMIAALAAMLVAAPTAPATFHFISIREVYPGSAASPASGYVVLQMYSAGQQFVGGETLTVYSATGTAIDSFTFPADLPNGANQRTILIGDSGVQGAFGVAPDLIDADLEIRAAGGAACWAGSVDCVSWGSFSGSTPLGVGTPADGSGIPNGMALRRTIEPICATLLEAADDSNDSASDFFDAAPQPRNNASAIAETVCTGPATTIDSKPANPTSSTAASFTYHSTPAAASFECKLDAAAFAPCLAAGIAYPGPLAEGNHRFQVRAKNVSEDIGPSASYSWRVDTIAPTAILDDHPADPSPGNGASFDYHASETGASFECSLAAGAAADSFSPCASSGKAYNSLADGEYTFKVRAKDAAANQGAATAFEWTVDNSLADTTPPNTTIDSRPLDPSSSSTASFTYHSSEPGSRFECKLDAAAFASCPAAGIEYSGLANGSHTFLVRAIDQSDNADLSPAGYTFDVVFAAPSPLPLPPGSPDATPAAPAPSQPRVGPQAPNTRIVTGPASRTRDRTPTLRFRASARGARFQCSLDRERFKPCRSPFTTKRVSPGRHRVRVRAIAGGAVDQTPATSVFRVMP